MLTSTGKKLVISVDTEAQPFRAGNSPLKTLIWGDLSGESYGISRMMDIADKHDVKLSFFLDFAEYDLYGEGLLDVGREVLRRDHDLQFHFHPEFLSDKFYSDRNITKRYKLDDLPESVAVDYVSYMMQLNSKISGEGNAFRGGGYRFSEPLLNALHAQGVTLTSNVNLAKQVYDEPESFASDFFWPCGIKEIPIATLNGYKNLTRWLQYNFNSGVLSRDSLEIPELVSRHSEFQGLYFNANEKTEVCTMVMHSWSFLQLDEAGKFSSVNERLPELFEAVIKNSLLEYEITTFKDL
jgi:hypothetical protein